MNIGDFAVNSAYSGFGIRVLTAFVLPQLETAMQDMWHQGSDTWFDRTADLRVLLNGGSGAPLAW